MIKRTSKAKKRWHGRMAAAEKEHARREKEIARVLAASERRDKVLMLKALKDSQRLERTTEHRRRAQENYDRRKAEMGGWPNARKKNPTKTQKREKARKALAKRRMAVALKNFLTKANPAGKYAGAKMQRNKGGSITIIPIKLRRAR